MAIKTEKDLAEFYADVNCQFWAVKDEEYDWPKGSKQHTWVIEHAERWNELLKQLEQRIFIIMQSEGVKITETSWIHILKPFMKRNGYHYVSGWWIKNSSTECESFDLIGIP